MIILVIFLAIIFFATILLICFACYQQGKLAGYDEMSAICKNSTDAAQETVDKALKAMAEWETASASWKAGSEYWQKVANKWQDLYIAEQNKK